VGRLLVGLLGCMYAERQQEREKKRVQETTQERERERKSKRKREREPIKENGREMNIYTHKHAYTVHVMCHTRRHTYAYMHI